MEEAKKNNSMWTDMIRPVIVLVVICLVASALLGFVNAKTAPVIKQNELAALAESMRSALPSASSFEELEISPELAAKGVTGFYKGNDDTGYVVVAANKGYGGDLHRDPGRRQQGGRAHHSGSLHRPERKRQRRDSPLRCHLHQQRRAQQRERRL